MKNKIKNWLKIHYKSIIIFIGILLMVSPVILSRELNNLDEIWNYNFARNIANGLIPYKDFNMLQTPLLPLIAGLFLKIFGNELIVMRVLAIFLISAIFFMIYKILKKLNVNIFFNLIFLFLLFNIFKNYICIDYNFAVLFLILILIYLELNNFEKNKLFNKNINLKNKLFNKKIKLKNNIKLNKNKLIKLKSKNNFNNKKNNKLLKIKNNFNNKNNYYLNYNYLFNLVIGLICGCCILLKQSTGIFITIASIIYPIFFVKNKVDLLNYVKLCLVKILGILAPIVLLLIYLFFNSAIYDFIDYTILGIKTFDNSIAYTNLINSSNITIKILSIGIPIFILICGIYLLINKNIKLYGFYFYSLASLIVIYPIADNIHFLIGITPFLILFVYLLFNFLNYIINKLNSKLFIGNKLNKIKKMILKVKTFLIELLKCLIILVLVVYIISHVVTLELYLNNPERNKNINHYTNICISDGLLNKITDVDNYILSQDSDVYILDAEAAIYMISLDKYNKDFDMFLKGNLGSHGELGQIEKIKNLASGTKILIRNNKYSFNWQTPMEVINYIRNNLNKIGEINIFDIYEIN